jgi:hypothetical protein
MAKSVLIVALAGLVIYQVSQLWFVDLTNRHFFPYLQARFPTAVPDGQNAFARPFRVIGGAGDGLFSVRLNGIETSLEWAFGENALDAVLQSGTFVGKSEIDAERVLGDTVFVFEYAFEMCVGNFSEAMGRRNSTVLEGVERFVSVAVQPPREGEPTLRAFFMRENYMWEFSLQLGTRRHAEEDFLAVPPSILPTMKHFIFVEDGPGALNFIPIAPRGGFAYAPLIAENPFRDAHGQLTLSMRSQLESFFSNPATIIPSVSRDNIYTFSDRNTVVRYLENHVLEYSSYRTLARTTPDLLDDFSAALAFVQDDELVINEIYLRNYEQRDGREHVFWFGYVINNQPLILTREWFTGANCTDPLFAPIVVVVENGRVVRYRRIVYTFRSEALVWKSTTLFPVDRYFSLGFPIGTGTNIELEVFS